MLYAVVYRCPHRGTDRVYSVCSSPEQAYQRLRECYRVRTIQDRYCHRMDWSIWQFSLLAEFRDPVFIYPGCTHYVTSGIDM